MVNPRSRYVHLAGMLTACLSVAACQSGTATPGAGTVRKAPDQAASGAGEQPRTGGSAGRAFHDPIARATLRERALTVLSSAAANGAPEERANAIEGLTAAPTRLAPLLDQALTDQSAGVRAVAAMAAGKAKVMAAVPQMQRLISGSPPQVQAAALYGLKRCGQSVDLTPLASMLLSSSPQVRAQAAYLLGELGEKSAVPLLKDAGKGLVSRADRAEIRLMDLQLAEARVKLGDESAMPEIRAALFPARPEDLEATALACQMVGSVHDAASANRLMGLLEPIDEKKQLMPAEVRLTAASSLAKLGLGDRDKSKTRGAYVADQYRANKRDVLRAQAALVYGDVGDVENLPLLSDMMNDPIGRVRVAAATAIVRMTDAAEEGVSQAGQSGQ